ncbi:MAG TPA: AI-2E family transporter [Anaerolineales bacterium]
MTKRLIVIEAGVLTTFLALLVLWQFRIAVVYLLISLTIAASLRPLVLRLVGRAIMIRLAWILLYLVILGSFVFIIFLVGRIAINEIQLLALAVSAQDKWILPAWLQGSWFQQLLIAHLPPPSNIIDAVTGNKGQLVLPALLGFTQDLTSMFSGLVIILLLSIYWMINQIHFERLWLSLLPSGLRKQARGIWRTIEPDLGAYIRSQVILSLLSGLLLGLGYWVIGSPYPALLSLVGTLACLIPVIGTPLAVFPPLVMGLLTNWQLSLYMVLYALIILVALRIWVRPHLFNRRWDNPILTLVILIAMANAIGLLGILIAPPISAICQILWNRLVSHRRASGAAAQISDLKERQERVWDTINLMKEPPLALVTSSMERLAHLIEKAEPVLDAGLPIPGLLDETYDPFHSPLPTAAEADSPGIINPPGKKP